MTNGVRLASSPRSRISYPDGTEYLRTGECNGCLGKATCCTYVQLPLARELTPDELNWVHLHPGLSVDGMNVRFEVSCSALEGGRCTLFGTDERPQMCANYPELPGLDPECSYQFELVKGVTPINTGGAAVRP